MAITDDLRKTLTDPTPLYFAAGTADLAVEQARRVPALIEQLRTEAPERIEAVRNTDPKAVQERVTTQAKEAQATVQAKVTEVFGALDTDLKKWGESAQDLALRSVGVAAEYAVRARETYEKVAERGEQSVRTWRGETAGEIVEIAAVVETEPKPVPKQKSEAAAKPAVTPVKPAAPAKPAPAKPAGAAKPVAPAAKKSAPAEKKAPARKPAAKKTTPPSAK
uniref:Heparin-binding hemagglutinin n=1 Tax=Streptomyces sp. NBC_01401 TaxID=2903854 RepID=A0AAU3GX27_9ACTN